LDWETLNWTRENGQKLLNQKIFFKKDFFLKLLDISFAPSPSWFTSQKIKKGIHGLRHILRVSINLKALLLMTENKIRTNLLIAASLHDLRRIKDRNDPNHGHRTAKWFVKNYNIIGKKYKVQFSNEDIDEIATLINLHNYDYQDLNNMDKYWKFAGGIDALKAADALDRYRLPKLKWWPNDKFLKLKPSTKLKALSFNLFLLSETLSLFGLDDLDVIKESLRIISNAR